MKYDDVESRETLEQLQKKVDSKLTQLAAIIGSELSAASGDSLPLAAANWLDRLDPEDRQALQMKAAAATGELQRLLQELEKHLEGIGAEMHRSNEYGNAAQAYGKNQMQPR